MKKEPSYKCCWLLDAWHNDGETGETDETDERDGSLATKYTRCEWSVS